jgi:hypothetical protein
MTPADRQAAALDRLRAKGLGLAPHMVDGKVVSKRSSSRPAERAALRPAGDVQGPGKVITPTRTPDALESLPAPGTVFEFEIPAPCEFLNANRDNGGHWASKAKKVRCWRRAGRLAATYAQLPDGLDRIRIDAYVIKPIRNRFDPANWAPTAKAVTDGLVDYGLTEDDNLHHVDGPFMHDGGRGDPALRIVVTVLDKVLPTS